ncbi:hypothetical protein Athai_47640 [Actinocatenispora thailandica]|uniref:WD40 repeat protein n=1 Tax=Actinocatenispora thailandica TaxID=227318 RepID=A0A7R7DT50_9ACTN|nr:PD40 domain-containing protein [Actinocatenispora thailandica]BCJ37261.1 hypothetical protein Athai_47640 [Actinocatenispora thailandica]
MTRIDDALRDTLQTLAGQAREADLGPAALRQARRRRRRRLAGTGAAAAVVLAAAITPVVAQHANAPETAAPRPHRTSAGPVPTETPAVVPPTAYPSGGVALPKRLFTVNGYAVTGWASQQGTPTYPSVLWDGVHRRYVKVDYSSAVPSPNGRQAVVIGQSMPYRPGMLDFATGTVTPLSIPGYEPSSPQWSPDGRTVLFTVTQKDDPSHFLGFALLDAATGKATVHWIDSQRFDSSQAVLSWNRDGTRIVLTVADRAHMSEATPDRVDHLQLFDRNGRPRQKLPVRGLVYGAASWSPDGRYVLAQGVTTRSGPGSTQLQVVRTSTGKVVARIAGGERGWQTPGVWLDDRRALVPTSAGGPLRTVDALTAVTVGGGQRVLGYLPNVYPAGVAHGTLTWRRR